MNRFGVLGKDGTRQIPPDWQNGISGARNAGEILGLQVSQFFFLVDLYKLANLFCAENSLLASCQTALVIAGPS